MRSVVLLLVAAASLGAQAPTPPIQANPAKAAAIVAKDVVWGIKGGFAAPTTSWIDDSFEVDIDGGFVLNGFVDYRLGPKITGTASIGLMSLTVDGDGDPIKDISAGLKAVVGNASSQFLFRPGFTLGFGSVGDGESYMVLQASVEMIPVRGAIPWLFDLGMMTAPVGGNDVFDATIEPRLIARFGRLF